MGLRFYMWVALLVQLIWAKEGNIVGKWKTVDDETKIEKSYVEIYEKSGKYYAKILEVLDPAKKTEVCTACEDRDDRKNQPLEGMEIIRDLIYAGKEYKNGTILDPKNGRVYTCKVWLDEHQNLKVRGQLSFFYRTQTWYRIE